jgi:hypothetical protein
VGVDALPTPEAPRHLGYYDPALLDPFFEEWRETARSAALKVREAFDHASGLRGLSAEWRENPERLREILLGGATRSVLRSMTVPVLMSH